jgi:hypothetical protein
MDSTIIAVLAWPGDALILGIVGIFAFRPELRRLVSRTQSVGKGWLVAGPTDPHQSGVAHTPEVADYLDSMGDELVALQEKAIRDDMATLHIEQKPDAEKALIRTLAKTQIALLFEQIHWLIWDGQVDLLETLNAIPGGAKVAEIESVYNEHFRGKREFYRDIDFDTYTAWLLEKELILIEDEKVALTKLGRGYLKWKVEDGRAKRGVG